jgi:hypothetical protein
VDNRQRLRLSFSALALLFSVPVQADILSQLCEPPVGATTSPPTYTGVELAKNILQLNGIATFQVSSYLQAVGKNEVDFLLCSTVAPVKTPGFKGPERCSTGGDGGNNDSLDGVWRTKFPAEKRMAVAGFVQNLFSQPVRAATEHAVGYVFTTLPEGGPRLTRASSALVKQNEQFVDIALACTPSRKGRAPETAAAAPPRFGLARDRDNLFLKGKQRATALPALVQIVRSRGADANGSAVTTTKFSIDATAGYAFASSELHSLAVYATYRNLRVRTSPPPETVKNDDVHGLDIGFVGRRDLENWRLTGSVSYVFDWQDRAERLRGSLGARFFGPFGPLDFGGSKLLPIGIRYKPVFGLQSEFGAVTRKGSAANALDGGLLLMGPYTGLDLFPKGPVDEPEDRVGGLHATVRYTYLFSVAGAVDDVERLQLGIEQRWWLNEWSAIGLGLNWQRGTDLVTFKRENELTLGVSLLF